MSLPSWAVVEDFRREHIERVALLVERFARERGASEAEQGRWIRAAWLHDALKDAPPAQLERWTPRGDWHPALWHGPAAAAAAAAEGERDQGVLDAVRYHSIGYDGWDDAGRILYLADYLEPGRPDGRQQRDAWRLRAAHEMPAVLQEVAAARIAHQLAGRQPLRRETWEFWNHLTAGA